jgi:hypothetical protein
MLVSRSPVRNFLFAAAAFVAALAGPAATACSIDFEVVSPSKFELVQMADAIVVARAVGENGAGGGVTFAVESAVKGDPPPTVLIPYARLQPPPRSDPSQPQMVYSDGGCGGRSVFEKGERIILFLSRSPDGRYEKLHFTFADQDYDGENGSSMRAIRRNAKLQKTLPWMGQLAALRKMIATRRDQSGSPLSDADIADIRSHFGRLSPWKSTPFLLEALRQEDKRGEPESAARSPRPKENELAQIVREFVTDSSDFVWPAPDGRRFLILSALIVGDHPDAQPVFDALLAAQSPNYGELGLALRFLARHGQYARAFRWIETRLMVVLPTLPADEADRLIDAVLTLQSGEQDEEEGEEPWRTDPHAASVWPELALSLYWHSKRFSGEGLDDLHDAIAQIPVADFRARPMVTLALADSFEPKVIEWAWAELNDEAKKRESDRKHPDGFEPPLELDPAYLPLRVLLLTWTGDGERDARLTRVFCQSPARRHLLIAELGLYGSSLEEGILARIATTTTLTREERDFLAGAIIHYEGRKAGDSQELYWRLADDARKLTGGQKPVEEKKAQPIDCPV